jgi:pilus assembly protein HofN
MIVEINFLEKKEKKKIAPYVFSFLAILFIVAILSIVYYQTHLLRNELSDKHKHIGELEEVVAGYQGDTAERQGLIQLQETIENQKQDTLPTVPMYQDILRLINSPSQLIQYEHTEQNQFVIDIRLPDFVAVSTLVT